MGLKSKHIVDAYKKSGLIPCRQCWITKNGKCGCGMTALYCSQHKEGTIDAYRRNKSDYDILDIGFIIEKWANHKYGEDFVSGFTYGFDGEGSYLNYSNEFVAGYNLGQKSYEAVNKEFKKKKKK